jgi:hypothetical protein
LKHRASRLLPGKDRLPVKSDDDNNADPNVGVKLLRHEDGKRFPLARMSGVCVLESPSFAFASTPTFGNCGHAWKVFRPASHE